jgi:5-carboxymethyl-2-hydroxymuconate isomerase
LEPAQQGKDKTMPHIVVEYSPGTLSDVPKILKQLHENLAAEESVDIARIKTRAVPVKDVVVGDEGAGGSMVHITVKLMPRPVDVAKRMASNLQQIVRSNVSDKCKVTAEVVELHPDTYCA